MILRMAKRNIIGLIGSRRSSHEQVLDVNWDIKEDQFTFFINLPHNPFTKRGVLSTIASLYDALGFVSPVVLEAKAFLQGPT